MVLVGNLGGKRNYYFYALQPFVPKQRFRTCRVVSQATTLRSKAGTIPTWNFIRDYTNTYLQ